MTLEKKDSFSSFSSNSAMNDTPVTSKGQKNQPLSKLNMNKTFSDVVQYERQKLMERQDSALKTRKIITSDSKPSRLDEEVSFCSSSAMSGFPTSDVNL
jgi:hypothetical protein